MYFDPNLKTTPASLKPHRILSFCHPATGCRNITEHKQYAWTDLRHVGGTGFTMTFGETGHMSQTANLFTENEAIAAKVSICCSRAQAAAEEGLC